MPSGHELRVLRIRWCLATAVLAASLKLVSAKLQARYLRLHRDVYLGAQWLVVAGASQPAVAIDAGGGACLRIKAPAHGRVIRPHYAATVSFDEVGI